MNLIIKYIPLFPSHSKDRNDHPKEFSRFRIKSDCVKTRGSNRSGWEVRERIRSSNTPKHRKIKRIFYAFASIIYYNIGLTEIVSDGEGWIDPSQDKWRNFVTAVTNLWVLQNSGDFRD
jgi:hypothetical protein